MKKILLTLTISVLLFSFAACKGKEAEEQAEVPQRQTLQPGPIIDQKAGGLPHGVQPPKTELQVVVPENVKAEWPSVIIIVEDKKENTKEEFTVNTDGEFQIPDSDLTVKVGPFLPDFKMGASTITSATSEPNNPSVGIAILQDGNKVFPKTGEWGWLYSKFPTIHSFQHDRFGLLLKEGVKK